MTKDTQQNMDKEMIIESTGVLGHPRPFTEAEAGAQDRPRIGPG